MFAVCNLCQCLLAYLPIIGIEPVGGWLVRCLTYGYRHTTIFLPAATLYYLLADSKLYWFVIKAHGVNNLFRVVTWQQTGEELTSQPFDQESIILTTQPPTPLE